MATSLSRIPLTERTKWAYVKKPCFELQGVLRVSGRVA